MTPKQFLQHVRKPPLKPAYLLLGDELYFRDRCRRALIQTALGEAGAGEGSAEGLVEVDLSERPLAHLVDEAKTLSLFATSRVIVGSNAEAAMPRAGSAKASAAAEILRDYVANPSPGVVLLFEATRYDWSDRDDKAKIERLVRFFSNVAESVELVRLTPREALAEAGALAKELRLKIDRGTLTELVDMLGSDMARLANELQKLALYAGSSGEVKDEDVEVLIPEARQRGMFEFSDALASGDRQKALEVLDTLAGAGGSWPMQINLIAGIFRQALAAKEQGARTTNQVLQLFNRHRVRIWPARARQVAGICGHFSLDQLEHALLELSRADRDLRRERPDDRIIMEQLVVSLTG